MSGQWHDGPRHPQGWQGQQGFGPPGGPQHPGYPQQQGGQPWGGQNPAPQQHQPQYNPWAAYQGGQLPPPKKRSKKPWIIGGSAFLLVAVLVVTLFVVPSSDEGGEGQDILGSGQVNDPYFYGVGYAPGPVKQYSTEVGGLDNLQPGQKLSNVDGRKLYWAMLKKQSMSRIVDLSIQAYSTTRMYKTIYPESQSSAYRSASDFKTREFVLEWANLNENGEFEKAAGTFYNRCVEGKALMYRAADAYFENYEWTHPQDKTTDRRCERRMKPRELTSNTYTSDGVSPGGLTAEQADKYISYLDGIQGLFTMGTPETVQGNDGKTYIRLNVNLNQLDPKYSASAVTKDLKMGVAFLQAGFAQTGIDPRDHPYNVDIGTSNGRKMVYFIDPGTLLPQYSITKVIGGTKLDGSKVDSGPPMRYMVFGYKYPDTLPEAAMKAHGDPVWDYRPMPFNPVIIEGE